MSFLQRILGSWHVSFGRLAINDTGGDYVVEETRVVPKTATGERYGVVCWNDRKKEFMGSTVHYLPAKPRVLHPLVDPESVISTPRGFRVSRPAEKHVGGFVRILQFDSTDPIGTYEMDIFVDGRLLATVAYKVI